MKCRKKEENGIFCFLFFQRALWAIDSQCPIGGFAPYKILPRLSVWYCTEQHNVCRFFFFKQKYLKFSAPFRGKPLLQLCSKVEP